MKARLHLLVVAALVACGSRPTSTLVATVAAPSASGGAEERVAPAPTASASAAPSPDEDVPDVAIGIDAPPRPPKKKYVFARPQAPGAIGCRKEKTQRTESFCILKTADEGSLARLLELGKATETSIDPHSPTSFFDDAGAADNAGVIAAKTSETELVAMLRDPEPATEGFALKALEHMMAILRMGYATGYEPDNARRRSIAPAIADACAPFVGAENVRVVLTALTCLQENGGARHAALLARVVAAHPSPTVKAAAARAFSGGEVALPVARAIARYLETPMKRPWYVEDVRGREGACSLLGRAVPSRPSWVGRAAAIAHREIWDHAKANGSEGACRRLAEDTANAPPSEKR